MAGSVDGNKKALGLLETVPSSCSRPSNSMIIDLLVTVVTNAPSLAAGVQPRWVDTSLDLGMVLVVPCMHLDPCPSSDALSRDANRVKICKSARDAYASKNVLFMYLFHILTQIEQFVFK